jgi:methylated-DNA-[protein]-cysteine S-methyltransferase
MHHHLHPTPLGDLLLLGDAHALSAIHLPGLHRLPPGTTENPAPFADAIVQLDEYFAGARRGFDLALEPHGGPFDRAVWDRVARIPYGETESYGRVARDIGHPDSPRAVGASNGRNPLPIVVPCHRVVGSDGSLTGYAGGLAQKQTLLGLEHGGLQGSLL